MKSTIIEKIVIPCTCSEIVKANMIAHKFNDDFANNQGVWKVNKKHYILQVHSAKGGIKMTVINYCRHQTSPS